MPIDWLTLGAAMLAGLLGGAHCAAMCGGIATGIVSHAPARDRGWERALEANGGRIAGYIAAGAIAGGLGHGIVDVARIHGLAVGLRMLVGVVMVVVALRLVDGRNRLGFLVRPTARIWGWLRPLQSRLLPANTRARRIALGMLWGWMPCGLSTTLLAIAWLQASATNGALTMAAFGLGTLPVMLPLTWSGARLGRWLHDPVRRGAAGACVMLAGLLTIGAPWLMQQPALHRLLGALGCLPGAY